jgi:RES domain-containing protein
MIFRIGNKANKIFSGEGARINGGRWNSPGREMIYCADNLSCCRLEVERHLGMRLPPSYKVVEIAVPQGVVVEELDVNLLPQGWDNDLDYSISSPIGDEWIDRGDGLLLRVPSVASPLDYCVVINPKHPDFPKLLPTDNLDIAWPKAAN